MVTSSERERNTKVVRIPKEIYEEAEKLRREYAQHRKNGSDPFAILAIAGLGAFIGGLIGYAIANLQQQKGQGEKDERNKI